jgi:hypothetical protein
LIERAITRVVKDYIEGGQGSMNKKWLFLSVGLVFVFAVFGFWFVQPDRKGPLPEPPSAEPCHFKLTYGSYFFPVSISKFTFGNLPCLPLTIGDQTLSAKLDLGFSGNLSCLTDVLAKIEDRKYLRTKKMCKFLGSSEVKTFMIPQAKIGKITFSGLDCQEDDAEFRKAGSILKEGEEESLSEEAAIGWKLFRTVNLFLDLGNSKIAFCDSMATLQDQGYPTDRFVKSKLLTERGFVECVVTFPEGPVRCVLDTGCTWNILHKELEENQSIQELLCGPNGVRHVPSLKIGEIDFGGMDFRYLPVHLPIPIEAFLGMEFFSKHLVFIDFAENWVYFAPNSVEAAEKKLVDLGGGPLTP